MAQTTDEKLEHVCRLMERMYIKLFGDMDGENPNGRLPLLEAKVDDQDKRLRSLERVALKAAGALALLGMLGGLMEAAAHLATAVRH